MNSQYHDKNLWLRWCWQQQKGVCLYPSRDTDSLQWHFLAEIEGAASKVIHSLQSSIPNILTKSIEGWVQSWEPLVKAAAFSKRSQFDNKSLILFLTWSCLIFFITAFWYLDWIYTQLEYMLYEDRAYIIYQGTSSWHQSSDNICRRHAWDGHICALKFTYLRNSYQSNQSR